MLARKLLCTLIALGSSGIATANGAPLIPTEWTIASGGNGHFYAFIAGEFTWDEAFADATSFSFGGSSGYLATVTSAGENNFLSSLSGDLGWLGGSDDGAAAVNDWTWRAGPEAGQPFTFTNWGTGEPNDCCGGENYLHTNWIVPGIWNDHGGPGNPGQLNGYFVEFSAPPVPEPGTYAMMLTGLGLVGFGLRRARKQSR
jgi:hypothetical protein